jgi:hypothetical protein
VVAAVVFVVVCCETESTSASVGGEDSDSCTGDDDPRVGVVISVTADARDPESESCRRDSGCCWCWPSSGLTVVIPVVEALDSSRLDSSILERPSSILGRMS